MKYSILILLFTPFLLTSQIDPIPFSTKGETFSDLIYTEVLENGDRRFYLKKKISVKGKGITDDGGQFATNVLQVISVDNKGEVSDETHLLYNPVFPTKGTFTIKDSYMTWGNNEDVMTYKTLTEKYPGLLNVRVIDNSNFNIPDVQYKSSLKEPFFKPKINGFSCQSLQKTIYTTPADAKGVLGGITKLNAKLDGKPNEFMNHLYRYETEKVSDLNWEDNYNGKQDKKNFWKNDYSFGCSNSGKLIAFTSHKLKSDDANEYKEKEVVIFDKNGNTISKKKLITETPWTIVKGRSYHSADGADISLESAVVVEKQYTSKKINKEGNKQQLKFTSTDIEGNINEMIVDLPFEAFRVDTLLHPSKDRIILIGGDRNYFNSYVVAINKGNANVYRLEKEKKGNKTDIHSVLWSNEDLYISYWNKGSGYKATSIDLYHFKNDTQSGPLVIEPEENSMTRWSFNEFYSDDNQILVIKKEEVEDCLDMKFCTIPRIYKLEGLKLTPINDPQSDKEIFSSLEVLHDQKPYKMGDRLYYFGFRIDQVERNGQMVPSKQSYIFNIGI